MAFLVCRQMILPRDHLILQTTHSLPKGIHTMFEGFKASVQEGSLLSGLGRLLGDVLDFVVREVVSHNRGENDVRQGLN